MDLAGTQPPKDVRVEVVLGKGRSSTGQLEDTEVMMLPATEENGVVAVFASDVVPAAHRDGLGYALRISPNHYDDPITRPVQQSV